MRIAPGRGAGRGTYGTSRKARATTGRAATLLALPILAAALGGCGPQHSLPVISEAERAEAARSIAEAPPPQAASRTPEQDAAVLARAASRLSAASQPFCAAYLGRDCGFHVLLDSSPAGSATMSAEASGSGRVTVSAGMLRALATEDEVAAVVAHEFGHHLAGHPARGLARGTAAGVAAGALVGTLIPFGGLAAWVIGQGAAELGGGAAQLAYSREEEREADYLAVFLLARASYDPARAGDLWARLAPRGQVRATSGVLDRHPSEAERLAAWRRTVQEAQASPDLVPRRTVAP